MAILLPGGAGFIGSHTAVELLNKGREIDWNNKEQTKYSFRLDTIDNEIIWDDETRFISQGTVYCLDENFEDVAIQEIGEERLKKYLRGE